MQLQLKLRQIRLIRWCWKVSLIWILYTNKVNFLSMWRVQRMVELLTQNINELTLNINIVGEIY